MIKVYSELTFGWESVSVTRNNWKSKILGRPLTDEENILVGLPSGNALCRPGYFCE